MSELFNEAEADRAVKRVLSRCKLIKKGTNMPLVKDNEGNIVLVIATEEINRQDLVDARDDAQKTLDEAQGNLDQFDELSKDTSTPEPTPVADPTPPADAPLPELPVEPVTPPTPDAPATPPIEATPTPAGDVPVPPIQ